MLYFVMNINVHVCALTMDVYRASLRVSISMSMCERGTFDEKPYTTQVTQVNIWSVLRYFHLAIWYVIMLISFWVQQ